MSDDLLTRLQNAVGHTYRIEREFAVGGQSRIFLAVDPLASRRVAIKLLPPEVGNAVDAERFKREIAVLGALAHPNIVPLLSTGHADGLTWYVMPFIRGESLADRLGHGALDVSTALQTLHELSDALAHAHGENVVHRDLKPENVLFQSGHAMLTDFGVAHARLEGLRRSSGVSVSELRRSAALSQGRLTLHGFAVGTPLYMAPEQFIGDDPADARADIYALATLGFEMLTGKPPFAAFRGAQLMVAHFTEVPPLVTSICADVPLGVAEAIDRGLAKDPGDRFANAVEFRDALGKRW